jgi:hypothetical protein
VLLRTKTSLMFTSSATVVGQTILTRRVQIMGDNRRYRAFAAFVEDTVPQAHRVADEATEPALRQALDDGMDFAIVPCCVFPMDGVKRSQDEWPLYLASLAPGIETTALPIVGGNTVLWRRRGHAYSV